MTWPLAQVTDWRRISAGTIYQPNPTAHFHEKYSASSNPIFSPTKQAFSGIGKPASFWRDHCDQRLADLVVDRRDGAVDQVTHLRRKSSRS
jgi:hypothetical protein